MRINQPYVDVDKYKRGGSIKGDYRFNTGTKVSMRGNADIELDTENSRLQQRGDKENYLCFKSEKTFVSKNLQVAGDLEASSVHTLSHNVQGDLHVSETVTAKNVSVTETITGADATISNELVATNAVRTADVWAERLAASLGATLESLTVIQDTNMGSLTTDGPNVLRGVSFIPDLSCSDFHSNAAQINFETSTETLVTTALATLHSALVQTTLQVEGDTTLKNVTADSLTVPSLSLTDLTTTNLHTTNLYAAELKSDLVFNTHLTGVGDITISTGPTDHEVYIGNDRIELTDHNPTHGGHIKLDVSSGAIQCNGGIQCFNDNPATNLVNPQGVVTDFVQTQAHRSDFGMNAAGESITASGAMKALAFRVTSTPGMPDFGGILPTHAYHQLSMVTRSMYASHYYSQDTDESSVHIDMEDNDIDMNVNAETLINIHETGARFFKEVTFSNADKLVFTGLTAAQIEGWPLDDNYLHNAADTEIGVRIFADAQHTQTGALEAKEVIAEWAALHNASFGLSGTGNVDFGNVEALDFTGLDASQIEGWPLGLHHAGDIAGGLRIFNNASQQHSGDLEAAHVRAVELDVKDAYFGVQGEGGEVGFQNADALRFTGLTPANFIDWPWQTTALHNLGDDGQGVKVFTDPTHTAQGTLRAAIINCTDVVASGDVQTDSLVAGDASFTKTLDFRNADQLLFTGVTKEMIVDWPLDKPEGLENITDTADGVEVTGTMECTKVRADFIEPHHEQILRVNGYDQVRIQNNLNVLGSSVLQQAFADHVHTQTALFTNDAQFNETAIINIGQIAELDVKNTDPYVCPQVIHLTYTNAYPDTAFLKCYLGGTDDYQKMSLGYDGMYIGEGLAFREDRKTRLFRQSVSTATGTEDRFVMHVNDSWIYTMARNRAVFDVELLAPNVKSSGSFTHCHVCEPEDQALDWAGLTGRLVESTGQCAVRDDAGALITDFSQAPTLSHAMCSVRLATTTCLGVVNSVETVEDGVIEHAHGVTLRHRVDEADGHKVVRVCGAGDCMVWTVKPIASETTLTPSLLSGLFTKMVNGVEQPEKVVLTCHEDFSFQMVLNLDSLSARVAALELAFQTLTNN